ncbi:SBBP repeat-containing protein [uncultured Arcticibacterium sp.]|uniref:SBBP repeat-containing protein n=1 Tax=uncultured Arcticibacterium sp. TaxID=2173042 RepID=UPI0030FAD6BA
MKKILLLLLACSFFTQAQNVTINPGGITPALTGTYPRISYDAILALPSPVIGDMAFDTTFLCMRVYIGTTWVCIQMPEQPFLDKVYIASAGSSSEDSGNSVAVDGSGNVYIVGTFQGTASFSGATITSAGSFDVFIAKYSSSGTLQWLRSAGGISHDYAHSIALDASGNVYISGHFYDMATFGGSNISGEGGYDIFMAKYNSSGSYLWVQSAGGTSNDYCRSLAVNISGDVCVSGYFYGTANFAGSNINSEGSADIYVAKYDSNGNFLWVRSAGGTSNDYSFSTAIDGAGNVYITGRVQGTANFGGVFLGSAGSYDIYIAKYNSVGALQWLQSTGGSYTDYGYSVAVDVSGNVYLTGNYSGTTNFGFSSVTSVGGTDIFIAKYNSSGASQWVQSAGSTSSDNSLALALDGSGNAYITGSYLGTANFGSSNITSAGGTDIFIAKYNSSGNLQWVESAGGSSHDSGQSVAVDGAANVYITGYYLGTSTFGVSVITSSGDTDVFLGRICQH